MYRKMCWKQLTIWTGTAGDTVILFVPVQTSCYPQAPSAFPSVAMPLGKASNGDEWWNGSCGKALAIQNVPVSIYVDTSKTCNNSARWPSQLPNFFNKKTSSIRHFITLYFCTYLQKGSRYFYTLHFTQRKMQNKLHQASWCFQR